MLGTFIIWPMDIVVPDEYKFLYEVSPQRPVLKVPHPALRQVAKEVDRVTKKTQLIIDDMLRIMKLANGVGLAGPQLGISQRIITINVTGVKPMGLVNPSIKKSEGEDIDTEGCLSVPGVYGDVKRAEWVLVEATDRKGRTYTYEFEGLPARVVQHEIDHLDGILFLDKVDIATLHWANPEAPENIAE